MFTESADIYDLVYSFKNYEEEAVQITAMIRAVRPEAKALLDIGCGTGEHHKYLKNDFAIDGLDLDEKLLQHARPKNSAGTYLLADMQDFSFGKTYDVVLCLFSSIGYLRSYAEIVAALKCFSAHLNAGGMMLVEPWFTRENWHPGRVFMLTHETDELKICRMSHSFSEGDFSILNFHYLIGKTSEGVRRSEERHELRMTDKVEMLGAFAEAGLEVSYEEKGFSGRGMYTARKSGV